MTKKIVKFKDKSYEVEDTYSPHKMRPGFIKHFKFMEMARVVSMQSDFFKFKIGAIIVKDGKVIARGSNRNKTHPEQKENNLLRESMIEDTAHPLHAEKVALNRVKSKFYKIRENSKYNTIQEYLADAKMYIYRIDEAGEYRMARCCEGCMQEVIDYGLKEIHYTTNEGYAMELINKDNLIKKRKRSI